MGHDMYLYKTQEEVEKDIKDGVLLIDDDVKFECSISIDADINARNIDACDIKAMNIDARNINARNIDAWDIYARDIYAMNIDAVDINAGDINVKNIDAWDILYYAFCCVYNSIKCKSIKAKRNKYQEPICLDGELIIKKEDDKVKITVEGKDKYIKREC